MPKDTFFNLPEAKRELIEDVALDEFATWGYDKASINRIVAAAQIAKGSFYQYFEDKKDLFKHLVDRITEEKLAYLSPVMLNPADHDFFTLVAELFRSGLTFGRQNPKAAKVANLLLKNKEHPVYQEIITDGKGTAITFYESLLTAAIARGEIRAEINKRFIGYMLQSMTVSIVEYYFDELMKDEVNLSALDDDVLETVQMTLDFIKHGITSEAKELI